MITVEHIDAAIAIAVVQKESCKTQNMINFWNGYLAAYEDLREVMVDVELQKMQ